MPPPLINTRRVKNRRKVRLKTMEDLVAEVDRLRSAAAAGSAKQLGNWSPAQVLWHIGKLIQLSFDGFGWRYRHGPEWTMRLMRWISWHWLIAMAFRPAFKNPPEAAVLEPDLRAEFNDAADFLLQQVRRIHSGEQMTQSCSVDGPYSHEQWIYIHLRHAELHLSFLLLQSE